MTIKRLRWYNSFWFDVAALLALIAFSCAMAVILAKVV